MATAPLSLQPRQGTVSGRELSLTTCDVRVWGMDNHSKPFVNNVTAGHLTEKGALLTGVLPVKVTDVVGVRYLERKARFKVSWVSDPDPAQTRSIGIDCIEDINFFGVRKRIPIEAVSSLYAESKIRSGEAPPNRRKAERYPCRVAADVTLDNAVAQAHAWVSDLSSKGCYLQMISPFPVGSGIALSIYGDDSHHSQPLVLRGVVRTSHPMVGMGVEFSNLSVNDLSGIQTVLEQLRGPKPMWSKQTSAAWTPANAGPQELESLPMAIEILSPRASAMQICAELQKLESEIFSLRDRKLTAELRQAALHMKNVAHLCPAG